MDIDDALRKIHLLLSDGTISFLLTDSRSLAVADRTLFFAITTSHGDGHRYIDELYSKGVRCFVVSRKCNEHRDEWAALYPDTSFFVVNDPLDVLQKLAAVHRSKYDIPVVGITGSNGKTIVKEWIYQLLAPEKVVTRSPRSYNSQVGVPLSVWLLTEHTEVAVLEAGISSVGEMQRLEPIIRPTIGVLTNIGTAHQENFDTMEQKLEQKLELFSGASSIVYCADEGLVARRMHEHYAGRRLIGWSVRDEDAPVFVYDIARSGKYIQLKCNIRIGDVRRSGVSVRIPFADEASVHNAVSAMAVALLCGVSIDDVSARLACLQPVAMRLEVKEGRNGCTIINDTYNSDLASLDIALDFMNRQKQTLQQPSTLVLSDMEQTGLADDQLYGEVAQLVRQREVDRLIVIGQRISSCRHLFEPIRTLCFSNTQSLIHHPSFNSMRNEIILLKGARRFHFEQLSELLAEKLHETTLEVNLNALVDNFNTYRSLLRPATRLMCMIKADAYGAGAPQVAKTLAEHRVDFLAVAVADEGVALRRQGIKTDIVVMNPEMSALRTLCDYRLEPEVYSFRLLEALLEEGRKEGIAHFPIHIKIDTGMHRLGFNPEEDMHNLAQMLGQQQVLFPRSVFTHLAGADEERFDEFTKRQLFLFTHASDELQSHFDYHILRHVSNTAAIEHFPQYQMDMCRLGLGLYGVSPYRGLNLQTVATLRTTILQIRRVSEGESVGYSRRTVLKRDSRIAAIPIGYADGLSRQFGNGRAFSIVRGQRAPYVGNICMDVALIDVTDIACEEGDSVEVFGENMPVKELADVARTIPYEVMTAVSSRVKKIYFKE